MRLHFKLTPNIETVPFNYQNLLIGTFHKWMGWNKIHDKISLYSLSWLQGSKLINKGFNFPKGSLWFISFWDENIGTKLITNALKEPEVFCGMLVKEIQIQDTPKFESKERFIASSPILIRKYDEKRKSIHLTYNNKESDFYLTETLKKKLKDANLESEVEVNFDRNYLNPKTKLVKINGIENKANFCPVIVKGSPEAVKFAWNVGIGHSTGCGFGALY